MNWKLIFNLKGTFVELYNKKGKVILCRPFLGWVREGREDDSHIQPKFYLSPDEKIKQNRETGDLIFKSPNR